MNLAIKEINDVLVKYFSYDYQKMIDTLEEIIKVLRSFKKYSENPEKYKGQCPKEIK